jgi:hypothetical protein
MKLKTLVLLGLSGMIVLAAGCRTAPLQNLEGMPVVTSTTNASLSDIQTAIIRAGASQGWKMVPTREGVVRGTKIFGDAGKHVAVVEVKYDSKAYSILYSDSTNLAYDGTKIHKTYNVMVQGLNRAIEAQLSSL